MDDILRKLIRFVVIGALCAMLFFFISYFLLRFAGLPLFGGLLLAYAMCFGLGYALQRNVAFRATVSHRRSLPRYLALQGACMVLVYFLTLWLQPLFELGAMGTSLVSTGFAGVASFVISLTWVFAELPQGEMERIIGKS